MINSRDLELFSEFVRAFYTPCPSADFPDLAASQLAQIVGGEGYSYTKTDIQQLRLDTNATIPLVTRYVYTRSGKAVITSELKSESELYRLAVSYWQILRPMEIEEQMCLIFQHAITSAIDKNIDSLQPTAICVCICPNQGIFTDRDRLLLNLLRPHLIQAYANSIAFTQTHDRLAQLDRLLEQANVIIVNFDGLVQIITPGAAALLQHYYDWRSASPLPVTLWRWLKFQILLVTANGQAVTEIVPLQVERGKARLTIRIVPDIAGLQLVLILAEQTVQELSIDSLQLIGLTEREAHVLILLTQDKTNIEIARILDCSLTTVKKHLEHLYDKFHVHHRTAAVIVALTQLGLIRVVGK